MSDDPIIRACVAQLDCPSEEFKHCGAVKAYQKRRSKVAAPAIGDGELCCHDQAASEASVNA
jgi:hypothetical protein